MFNHNFVRSYLLVLIATPVTILAQAPPAFFAQHFGGKCLDFGAPPQTPGSPVFLYDCNGTVAQQVRIQEINSRHEVMLRVGSLVIGVKEIPPTNTTGPTRSSTGVVPAPEMLLELQNEARSTLVSLRQIFALDGDSIILASNRNLVVKGPNGRWANRTPLIAGRRDLTDAEFWTFRPADRTAARLTRGFVRVPQEDNFKHALRQAGPGTVIEVNSDITLELDNEDFPLDVPAGVTIRGGRNGVQPGAEIYVPYPKDAPFVLRLLFVTGNDVRITGLRLRGPSRGRHHSLREALGIDTDSAFNTIIDRNEMSEWPAAPVFVSARYDIPKGGIDRECTSLFPGSRPETVRIARNFLHNNEKWAHGYGVEVANDGYARIERNTFSYNRHAISDDGSARSGYRAWLNLVLTGVPTYSLWESDSFPGRGPQQDFDMHGTDPASGTHYVGGVAGLYLESAWNTFLGSGEFSRHNFELRGTPCYFFELHNNVSRENLNDAIEYDGNPGRLIVTGDNRFNAPNPTDRLGVGDFDGDKKEDLFLATGAAWYYAPGGTAEWRYLNAMTEVTGSLLFGDFDADGRTDVFTQRGRDWLVSWGGISAWEKINESDAQMSDFGVGDFDGDGRADIFYADGHNWWISQSGVRTFEFLNTSTFRIADLRFGDFNADGRTDLFGIGGNQWKVSYGGNSAWSPLPHALTGSVAGLMVGDFNGDGRADIATLAPTFAGGFALKTALKVSYSGASDWTTVYTFNLPPSLAAVGRFDANNRADLLLWHDNYFDILSGATGLPKRHSLQDMR